MAASWPRTLALVRPRDFKDLHTRFPSESPFRVGARVSALWQVFRLVECLKVAGQRPSSSTAATSWTRLHLGLLGDLQRIVDLDPEVSDSAFKFGVPEQQLNRPEILRPPVDQRRFGAPH